MYLQGASRGLRSAARAAAAPGQAALPWCCNSTNLQWGDEDGISLLLEILRPPEPPPLPPDRRLPHEEESSSRRRGASAQGKCTEKLGRADHFRGTGPMKLSTKESEAAGAGAVARFRKKPARADHAPADLRAMRLHHGTQPVGRMSGSGATLDSVHPRAAVAACPKPSQSALVRDRPSAGQPYRAATTALAT